MSTSGDDVGSSAQEDVAALLGDGTVAGSWVLDPVASRVEFHVKHFWGAITVHGSFDQIAGEGSVGADGSVTGRMSMEAGSLVTKNERRDKHLRSADFFDAEHYPDVVVTVTGDLGLPGHPRGGRADQADRVQRRHRGRQPRRPSRFAPSSWSIAPGSQ